MSSPPSAAQGALPRPLRRKVIACLLLSGFVGYFATSEAFGLAEISPHEVQAPSISDPALDRLLKAQTEAMLAGARQMRDSRMLLLGALSVCCSVVFVAAARLLQSFGVPRLGSLRLLGGATFMAAVLRTLEGAQWTVIAKRAGAALDKAASESQQPDGWPSGIGELTTLVLAVSQTALVAGAFVLLSVYFRSLKVRQMVELADEGL